MKIFTFLICLISFLSTFAQFGSCIEYGIIKDSDGYTNVRKDSSSKSEIIHTLKKNVVFEIIETPKTNDWVKIKLIENPYGIGDINEPKNNKYGFIHKSRIIILNNLDIYKGNDVQFSIITEPFDPSCRILTKHNGNGWLTHIDGRPVHGTDGNIPKNQIKSIKLSVKGIEIPIHNIFKSDLFECRNQFDIIKVEDTYFVHQSNSDGAGYYEVLWVFNSEKLLQRIIWDYPC